ncbi:hypothetical protein [Methanosarcina sp.]
MYHSKNKPVKGAGCMKKLSGSGACGLMAVIEMKKEKYKGSRTC